MNKYTAEALGTFVLVFGGVGSAVLAGTKIGFVGIAFAFGLSLLAMVYTIGPISGCHINPAVTVGVLFARKISWPRRRGIHHCADHWGGDRGGHHPRDSQGLPGGYDASAAGLGANGYGAHSPSGFSLGACFLAEIVLTMFLVLTVLGSTDVLAPVGFAGIPIGLVLTLIHLVGIPITNTSVNPARSIGPALFVGGWAIGQLWMFIVAPLIGAALAAGAYGAIRRAKVPITTREAEEALASERREREARATKRIA